MKLHTLGSVKSLVGSVTLIRDMISRAWKGYRVKVIVEREFTSVRVAVRLFDFILPKVVVIVGPEPWVLTIICEF